MGWARKHKTRIAIFSVLALLIGLRVAAPYAIEWYVNRTLDRDPAYDGHISDVDLYLYLGMYTIEDVDIVQIDGDAPVPLFSCDEVQLSIQWKALFKGAIVGEIDLMSPVLNIAVVEGGQMQDGGGADWQAMVLDLFPVQINRFALHDGEVHYLDIYAEPTVDLWITAVQAEVRNLTNVQGDEHSMVADFDGTALVMQSGQMNVEGTLDPYADDPTFDLSVSVRSLNLVEINPWLDAYVSFDINEGTMDAYAEIKSSEGNYNGYLKPLLYDVDVFDKSDLREGGPLRVAWEGIVGLVKGLFSNETNEQVATVAPIQGRYDAPGVGVWRTITAAVKNAFIQVLTPGFEGARMGGEPVDDGRMARDERLTEKAQEKIDEAIAEAEEERAAAQEAYREQLAKAEVESNPDKAARLREDAEEELAEELQQADDNVAEARSKWSERVEEQTAEGTEAAE